MKKTVMLVFELVILVLCMLPAISLTIYFFDFGENFYLYLYWGILGLLFVETILHFIFFKRNYKEIFKNKGLDKKENKILLVAGILHIVKLFTHIIAEIVFRDTPPLTYYEFISPMDVVGVLSSISLALYIKFFVLNDNSKTNPNMNIIILVLNSLIIVFQVFFYWQVVLIPTVTAIVLYISFYKENYKKEEKKGYFLTYIILHCLFLLLVLIFRHYGGLFEFELDAVILEIFAIALLVINILDMSLQADTINADVKIKLNKRVKIFFNTKNLKWQVFNKSSKEMTFDFNQFLGFNITVNEQIIFSTENSMAKTLAGGVLFGSLGAVAGALKENAKQKVSVIKRYNIELSVDDLSNAGILLQGNSEGTFQFVKTMELFQRKGILSLLAENTTTN